MLIYYFFNSFFVNPKGAAAIVITFPMNQTKWMQTIVIKKRERKIKTIRYTNFPSVTKLNPN